MANNIKTNRSIRLNGINPLAYVGVNPYTPPDYVIFQRDPTPQDWQNFQIGAIWLNQQDPPTSPPVYNVWMLVSLYQNKALWIQFAGGAGAILGLEARDGTIAFPVGGLILFKDEVIPGSGNAQSNILTSVDPNFSNNFVVNLTNTVVIPGAFISLLNGNGFVGQQMLLERDTNNAVGPSLGFLKTRISGGGGGGIVQAGDVEGRLTWGGFDGVTAITNAEIQALVTGVPALGNVLSSLNFYTGLNAGQLVMTMSSAGNVMINAPASGYTLNLGGVYGVAAGTPQQALVIDSSGNVGVGSGGDVTFWSVVTGAAATMAVNQGYIANNAGTCALTLPAISPVGSVVRVTGINNATGWQIAQNAGNQILFGASATTAGATGYLQSSATNDAVELLCVTANANWLVLSSVGNITVH